MNSMFIYGVDFPWLRQEYIMMSYLFGMVTGKGPLFELRSRLKINRIENIMHYNKDSLDVESIMVNRIY